MECGIIYIKVCPKKGNTGEWLKYCHIFSVLPKSLQENIKQIANDINTKYSEDIVIPMDISLHPGCTTTADKVEDIATDMFNQFSDMMERNGLENCVREAYSIGEINNPSFVDSTHHLQDDIMIQLGEYLDESDEPGLFKV